MQHSNRTLNLADSMNQITIVCLSDTHELHRQVEVPDGDVLVHAGDFTMFSKSTAALRDFNEWLGELSHRYKVLVPGNHEFAFEDPSRTRLITHATLLINEGVEILGLKIWGSPSTPLYGGAFGLSHSEDRKRLYDGIPGDTDILITHGPPYGILDQAPEFDVHAGDPELLKAVLRIRPKLHIFGHVHGGYGLFETGPTTFINAALLGSLGNLDRAPIVIRLKKV